MVKLVELIATYVMAFAAILFGIGVIIFLVGNFGTPSRDEGGPRGCGLMGFAAVLFLLMGLIIVFVGHFR
jgi:hypothetical protein